MAPERSASLGKGIGVYGGTWGAAPHEHNPWLPTAQVAAALSMFWPLLTACTAYWSNGCTLQSACTIEVIVSWIAVMPLSIVNHLGHAVARRWVPVLQKLDRSSIAIGSIAGSWALSQSAFFTVGSVLLSTAVIATMWMGPPRYRDSEILASTGVAVGILYGLIPMLIFRESFDPNFIPATAAILTGFLLFQFDPLGVWTDTVWHFMLGVYTYYCALSAIEMDRLLHKQCLG
eukprot:TRINITY_DN36898_c0_g1_i1.p1 TRINITY_DN36898_c0_g1~~TRINITY_DN36898_c0_g1_i1.p1  ORF type:complete len:244 (-),score=36.66 TRINITY_DN36898_c0_g1_i1:9-704(-)